MFNVLYFISLVPDLSVIKATSKSFLTFKSFTYRHHQKMSSMIATALAPFHTSSILQESVSLAQEVLPPLDTSSLSNVEQDSNLTAQFQADLCDLLIITGIFRVRTVPAVPYSMIAKILLDHYPIIVKQWWDLSHPESRSSEQITPSRSQIYSASGLFTKHSASNEFEDTGEAWSALVLESKYITAERDQTAFFENVLKENETVVADLLHGFGLAKIGFRLRSSEGIRVYIEWLRGEDWRFGSEPLAPLLRAENGQWGAVGDGRPGIDNYEDESKKGDDVDGRSCQAAFTEGRICGEDMLEGRLESLVTVETGISEEGYEAGDEGSETEDELIRRLEDVALAIEKLSTTTSRHSSIDENSYTPREAFQGEEEPVSTRNESKPIPHVLYSRPQSVFSRNR